MAKIVLSLADGSLQEEIAGALRLSNYRVEVIPAFSPEQTPKMVAAELVESKGEVAILDYNEDDAFSVKMLQASTDHARIPRFIFVLPEGASVSHILMAVNEGASALVQKPFNMDALLNYVERAISGPSRFRYDADKENTLVMELSELEKEAKTLKTQASSYRKLVAYIMSTPVSQQHRTALIVSDSAYQRDYLKKLLEDHGFHVVTAGNPEEGLKVALDEKPRIVISDLEMEGKNGVEFCHELKIVNKYMPCFFVICTANSEKVDEVLAPGNGVDGCVIKPSSESGNVELVATAAMGLLL